MKKIVTIALCLLLQLTSGAQEISCSLNVISEGQYNLNNHKANWSHLTDLSVDVKLWRGAAASAEVISTYNTHDDEPIANDLQGYSNINAGSKALRFSVLGISQRISHLTLFAGLRNTGPDYFASKHTALFSGSSHGIHAPLANNYDVATYPMAEMCLHAEWRPIRQLTIKSTFYNGQAGENISEQFLFRNQLKNITTLSYQKSEEADSGYYCIGMMTGHNILGNQATALFGIAEIPLINTTHPLLCGILEAAYDNSQPDADNLMCRGYYAIGAVVHLDNTDNRHFGIIINKAFYQGINEHTSETDLEMNYSQQVGIFCIQPILHLIKTGASFNTIAMMRFSTSF